MITTAFTEYQQIIVKFKRFRPERKFTGQENAKLR